MGIYHFIHKLTRIKSSRTRLLRTFSLICLFSPMPATALGDDSDSFWTQFTPSTDTRLIFVSESEGNNSNSGLTPNQPVKTLAKGYSLLRDEAPDWMLLKRGDTWNESLPGWNKSGRSESEMMVVGGYGDTNERPQIRPDGSSHGMMSSGTNTIQHIAFVGFHLEPAQRSVDQSPIGIRWLHQADNILFEDVLVKGFKDNFVFQEYPPSNSISNIRLNGCILLDSWNDQGHSQGLFASDLDGLIIENCVFDSNGFSTERGVQPTWFNHNAYIQHKCLNVVVKNNIFARGAATGIQLRPGGVLQDNLFIKNPVSFMLGFGGQYATEGGISADARRNTVMYGVGLDDNTPRAFGAVITNARSANVSDNIFYSSVINYNGQAIQTTNGGSYGLTDILIENNSIVNWYGPIQLSAPGTGLLHEDIRVLNNHIYRDLTANNGNNNWNKPLITCFDSNHPSVTISNNNYNYIGMHNRPFVDNSIRTPVETWRSQVEPDGSFAPVDQLPSGLGLDSYLVSIGAQSSSGEQEGIGNFLQLARNQSRQSYDNQISAHKIYQWMKQKILDH
jgi:hypothetical protein